MINSPHWLVLYWIIAGLWMAISGLFSLRNELDKYRSIHLFFTFVIVFISGGLLLPATILDAIYQYINKK